jgi:hypothetical protein
MTPRVCRGRCRGRQLVRGSQLPLSRGSSFARGADPGGAGCCMRCALQSVFAHDDVALQFPLHPAPHQRQRQPQRTAGPDLHLEQQVAVLPRGSTRPLNTELTIFDPPARSHKRGRSKRTHSLMAAGACVNSTRKRPPHRPGRRSASGCASAGCSTPARWPGRWRSRRPPRQAVRCPPRPRPPRLRPGARGSTAVWCVTVRAAGRLRVLAVYTRLGTLPVRVNTNRIAL